MERTILWCIRRITHGPVTSMRKIFRSYQVVSCIAQAIEKREMRFFKKTRRLIKISLNRNEIDYEERGLTWIFARKMENVGIVITQRLIRLRIRRLTNVTLVSDRIGWNRIAIRPRAYLSNYWKIFLYFCQSFVMKYRNKIEFRFIDPWISFWNKRSTRDYTIYIKINIFTIAYISIIYGHLVKWGIRRYRL